MKAAGYDETEDRKKAFPVGKLKQMSGNVQRMMEEKSGACMKGLELSEKYYETYGRRMIYEQFSDIADQTAVGLVGYGSECLGFDDEVSADHD